MVLLWEFIWLISHVLDDCLSDNFDKFRINKIPAVLILFIQFFKEVKNRIVWIIMKYHVYHSSM